MKVNNYIKYENPKRFVTPFGGNPIASSSRKGGKKINNNFPIEKFVVNLHLI